MQQVDDEVNRTRASKRATGAGLVGSAFALLCCAGAAPVIGVLSALGLGLLVRDAVLIPLLIVGLGVTLWGLWQGRRCHGRDGALAVGAVASLITVGGVLTWIPLAFVGFAGVIGASILNVADVRARLARPSLPA